MNRRNLLKYVLPSLCLNLPLSSQATLRAPKFKMRKNVVLVTVDLGLFEKNFREYDNNCPYFVKHFSHMTDNVTYFKGMSQPGLGGGHDVQHATFTCLKYTDRDRYPERSFISLDQHLAERSIQETRHRSIYHKVSSGDNVSFNSQAQPTPSYNKASDLHDNLFGYTDMGLVKQALAKKRFIMKELLSNVKRRWKGTPEEIDLAASLEYKMDDIETQEKWLRVRKPRMTRKFDNNIHKAPLLNIDWNFSTIFNSLEKEQTKIAVIQFGGGSALLRGLPEITHGYHTLSHHSYYKERTSELEIVDSYILAGLGKFLTRLQDAKMLDDTIVLFTCAMADANRHSSRNIPAFLFGGGFKHKKMVECSEGKTITKPTSHLFSSILKQAGSSDTTFSGNKEIIQELFA